MSKLFTPILIPAGIEQIGGKTKAIFTLWFQLNPAHKIFSDPTTGPMPAAELKAILNLPLAINKLKRVKIKASTLPTTLTGIPVLSGGNSISPEGIKFYQEYFNTVISESRLSELASANIKFANSAPPVKSSVESILYQKTKIETLGIPTNLRSNFNSRAEGVDYFNTLNQRIRSFSDNFETEKKQARAKLLTQLTSYISSNRAENRLSEIDSFVSLAPSYVLKAFDALGNNNYIQHFTGLFTKIAIDFSEIKYAFGSTKKMSLLTVNFDLEPIPGVDLNQLCFPAKDDTPNPPTCVKLIEDVSKNKYAVLLDTYSNSEEGSGNFPYDDFFENGILKSLNQSTRSRTADLVSYEGVSKLFTERYALAKSVELLRQQTAPVQSLFHLLSVNIAQMEAAGIGASKVPENSEERLKGAIDFLEFSRVKAKGADDIMKSVNAADEKITSGLSLLHPTWHKLIKPDIDQPCLFEHVLTSGYAVAIRAEANKNSTPFTSLTRRKEFLTIQQSSGTPISTENNSISFGAVSGDALMNALQPIDGTGKSPVVHLTDNVLFTWLGHSLGLKDANKGHENDTEEDETDDSDIDLETQVLASRTKRIFNVDSFPFLRRRQFEQSGKRGNYYFLNFGIDNRVKLPRLLFSKTKEYQFLFYCQYVNGWQLPLQADLDTDQQAVQLSIQELIGLSKNNNVYFSGKFTRNEHVKKIKLFHTENILSESTPDAKAVNKTGKEGESLEHLVIRSDKRGTISNDACSRHILPAEISPAMAQWHGCFLRNRMDVADVYRWHLKYHCQLQDKSQFNDKGCLNGCSGFCGNHQMKTFYTDDHIIPNYLPDPLAEGFLVQFYRDPELSLPARAYGFNDVKCDFSKGAYPQKQSWKLTIVDAGRSYENGSKVDKNSSEQRLTIYLRQGLELYAKITSFYKKERDDVVLNRIVNPLDRAEEAEFKRGFFKLASTSEFGDVSAAKIPAPSEEYFFETYPQTIILTHAVKQPLVRPEILNVQFTKYLPQADSIGAGSMGHTRSFVKATLDLHFEMLNVVKWGAQGVWDNQFTYINGLQPTGDLELWGKWEDFADNPKVSYRIAADDMVATRSYRTPRIPQMSLEDKSNDFKFLGKVKFESEAHMNSIMHLNLEKIGRGNDLDFTDFKTRVTVDFDIEKTQATSFVFQIRNASRFGGFFPDHVKGHKNIFQSISNDFIRRLPSDPDKISIDYPRGPGELKKSAVSAFYLNNQKPGKPVISRIVPMIVTDANKVKTKGKDFLRQTTRYNRFRFFLKRDLDSRLVASSNERIGIILKADKPYNKYFHGQELTSRIGTDWITDTNLIVGDKAYLTAAQFSTGLGLENDFIDQFEPLLLQKDAFIDLLHCKIQFDAYRNNWYFDAEINFQDEKGGEYHNPFIQMSLVTFYQPGINYTNEREGNPVNDYRLSEITQTGFISLLPSRTVTARIYSPNLFRKTGQVDFALDCNIGSLFFGKENGELRSQIYAGIRETYRDTYTFISSWKADDAAKTASLFHPLLDENLKNGTELIGDNKIANREFSFEFSRQGIFGHKYELVLVEFENFLPENVSIDCNSTDFFKLPGRRIKYIEIM